MPAVGLPLVQADSAIGLIVPTQGPNTGSTAMSLTTASKNVTNSQVRGAPQPQGPLSTAFPIPSTAFKPIGSNVEAQPGKDIMDVDAFLTHAGDDMLIMSSPSNDDTPTSSTRNSVGIDGEMTNQFAHLQSAQSVPNVANHPSTTASITTDGSNLKVPNGKTFIADSASTFVPFLDINNPLSPTFGTHAQAITANPESQKIFISGLALSKGSATTLGSGASISILAPQISDTQPSITSDSLLSYATTMPTLSREPSFLTMSGQTVTADSLGQHSTDIQPLTKGTLITVSGTTISLAPSESHINVGMSTVNSGHSATVNVGSGSNGTEVQKFSGNALGARDGLWGSSTMFLVFFVVLLWL